MRRPCLMRIASYLDTITNVGTVVPDIDLDAGKIRIIGKLNIVDVCVHDYLYLKIGKEECFGNFHICVKFSSKFSRTKNGWNDARTWLKTRLQENEYVYPPSEDNDEE